MKTRSALKRRSFCGSGCEGCSVITPGVAFGSGQRATVRRYVLSRCCCQHNTTPSIEALREHGCVVNKPHSTLHCTTPHHTTSQRHVSQYRTWLSKYLIINNYQKLTYCTSMENSNIHTRKCYLHKRHVHAIQKSYLRSRSGTRFLRTIKHTE